MKQNLHRFIGEIGALVTVGVGIAVIKLRPKKPNPILEHEPELARSAFAPIIVDLYGLKDEMQMLTIMNDMKQFLQLYENINAGIAEPGAQFIMNRFASSIVQQAQEMCYKARSSKDNDVLTAAIDCERETLNILQTQCDNLIRNTLLSSIT